MTLPQSTVITMDCHATGEPSGGSLSAAAAMAEIRRSAPGVPGEFSDGATCSLTVGVPSLDRRQRVIQLADAVARRYRVAATVSSVAAGTAAIALAHEQASAVLRRAGRLGHIRTGCVAVERLQLCVLLAAIPSAERSAFRESVFATLDSMSPRRRLTLVATLRALEATGGHVRHTALLLDVSEKTVRRHIDEIKRATGLPISCLEVRICLQLLDLEGSS